MAWAATLFVQINDFYHIDYLLHPPGPTSMVLPRLATLLGNLRKLPDLGEGYRILYCLPGDFLSPSCLSRHFHGGQMIDLMKRLGLNVATLGNHEFDFEEGGFQPKHLYKCLERSQFDWICSNFEFSQNSFAQSFARHPRCLECLTIQSEGHCVFLFAFLYADTWGEFGRTLDPVATCKRLINEAKLTHPDLRHTYIALTHQNLDQDKELARECPELRLIMGGHDHNVLLKEREDTCLIVKAKSNARSIRLNWIVRVGVDLFDSVVAKTEAILRERPGDREYKPHVSFVIGQFVRPAVWAAITGERNPRESHPRYRAFERYMGKRGMVEGPGVTSHRVDGEYILVFSAVLDTEVPEFIELFDEDPVVRKAIDKWVGDYPGGKQGIFVAPTKLVMVDEKVRSTSTNFGNYAADVVRRAGTADIGVVNGGSFRLGRNLARGETITGRILCEIFFHKNDIRRYRMPGRLVRALLERSLELSQSGKEGHGDFLQISGVCVAVDEAGQLTIEIAGRSFDDSEQYVVATTKYVAEKAYSTVFAASEFIDIVSPSIRDAVEHAFKTEPIFDAAPRWRFETPSDLQPSM